MARITLCGSTRFKDAFLEWDRRLSLEGHVVYSVSCFGHSGDELTGQEKAVLDRVHMLKIDNSDEIFVLDVGGYIGASTRREIEYAKLVGRKIRYLSEITKED